MIFLASHGCILYVKNHIPSKCSKGCFPDSKLRRDATLERSCEFEVIMKRNSRMLLEYCDKHRITYEFSAPKTPEQSGVVERKNRTIQDMARVMPNAKGVSH